MTVNPEKAAQRREAEAELAATEPEPERIKEEPATGFIVEMETGQWIEWINPADGSTETTSDRKSARVFHSATTRATFEWLGYRAEAP